MSHYYYNILVYEMLTLNISQAVLHEQTTCLIFMYILYYQISLFRHTIMIAVLLYDVSIVNVFLEISGKFMDISTLVVVVVILHTDVFWPSPEKRFFSFVSVYACV